MVCKKTSEAISSNAKGKYAFKRGLWYTVSNDNLSKHAKYKEENKEFLIKAWIFENVFKNKKIIK